MAGIFKAINKATSRASRNLSREDLNKQIDIMLGREQRAGERAAAKVADKPQTQLEILRAQLVRDEQAKRVAVETQAKAIVNRDVNASVDARNTQIGLDNAASKTKQVNRASEAQQAEATANRESFLSQLGNDVTANQARVKSEAAMAKALAKAQKGKKTAAATDVLGVLVPTTTVLMGSGVAALALSDHLNATLQDGKLVDPAGNPISDKTITAASKNNQVSFLQPASSVEQQIAEHLPYTDVQVTPNGSEIIIDGRTIDRAAVQKDNGVTIITKAEARANGIDNPSGAEVLYISGDTTTKFDHGIDSKRTVTTSLPKSISNLTGQVLGIQQTLDAEATTRAVETVTNDPMVQEVFNQYGTMTEVQKSEVDKSLRVYRDKAKLAALKDMAKDPQFAGQMDEITLLNETKTRMVSTQASLNSMPEEVKTLSLAFPGSIGHPTVQASYLSDKELMNKVIIPFETKGRVEGVDRLVDKGHRDAAINLASRTSGGREDLTRSIAGELITIGDQAMTLTQQKLALPSQNLTTGLTTAQREAKVTNMYRTQFHEFGGLKISGLLLSQAGLPPEMGSIIRANGVGKTGVDEIINLLTGGKELTTDNIDTVRKFAGTLKGMDTRIRQLVTTQPVLESAGLSASSIIPHITAFANNLTARVRAVEIAADTQSTIIGFGEHLTGF